MQRCRKPIIELYEEICPKCGGYQLIKRENFYEFCKRCNGKGIVDWVDKIKLRKE